MLVFVAVVTVALVLVCGSRVWADVAPIRRRLARLAPGTRVVTGGAAGADTLAIAVAIRLGLDVEEVPAHWTHGDGCRRGCRRPMGKVAGPIRNRQMLDRKPDLVIAFHPDLDGASRGTKDCVAEARRRGIPVEVITE